MERTNPIFNTARMTLFQLAVAGHDDAKAIVERLNLSLEDTQDSKTVKSDDDALFINSIIMDVRYFTNGKLAKESVLQWLTCHAVSHPEPLNLQKEAINLLEWIFLQQLMNFNLSLCHCWMTTKKACQFRGRGCNQLSLP